jgi:hypothetical protein
LRLPGLANTFLSGRLLLQVEREREREGDGDDDDDDDDALLKENWKARSRTHSFFFFLLLTLTSVSPICLLLESSSRFIPSIFIYLFLLSSFRIGFFFLSVF